MHLIKANGWVVWSPPEKNQLNVVIKAGGLWMHHLQKLHFVFYKGFWLTSIIWWNSLAMLLSSWIPRGTSANLEILAPSARNNLWTQYYITIYYNTTIKILSNKMIFFLFLKKISTKAFNKKKSLFCIERQVNWYRCLKNGWTVVHLQTFNR